MAFSASFTDIPETNSVDNPITSSTFIFGVDFGVSVDGFDDTAGDYLLTTMLTSGTGSVAIAPSGITGSDGAQSYMIRVILPDDAIGYFEFRVTTDSVTETGSPSESGPNIPSTARVHFDTTDENTDDDDTDDDDTDDDDTDDDDTDDDDTTLTITTITNADQFVGASVAADIPAAMIPPSAHSISVFPISRTVPSGGAVNSSLFTFITTSGSFKDGTLNRITVDTIRDSDNLPTQDISFLGSLMNQPNTYTSTIPPDLDADGNADAFLRIEALISIIKESDYTARLVAEGIYTDSQGEERSLSSSNEINVRVIPVTPDPEWGMIEQVVINLADDVNTNDTLDFTLRTEDDADDPTMKAHISQASDPAVTPIDGITTNIWATSGIGGSGNWIDTDDPDPDDAFNGSLRYMGTPPNNFQDPTDIIIGVSAQNVRDGVFSDIASNFISIKVIPDVSIGVSLWTVPNVTVRETPISASVTFTHDIDTSSIAKTDFEIVGPANIDVSDIVIATTRTFVDGVTLSINLPDNKKGSFAIRVKQGQIGSSETYIKAGPASNTSSPFIQYNTILPIPPPVLAIDIPTQVINLVDASQTNNTLDFTLSTTGANAQVKQVASGSATGITTNVWVVSGVGGAGNWINTLDPTLTDSIKGSLRYIGTPPDTIIETESFPITIAAQNIKDERLSATVYTSFVVQVLLPELPPPPVWGMIPTQVINLSDASTTNNTLDFTLTTTGDNAHLKQVASGSAAGITTNVWVVSGIGGADNWIYTDDFTDPNDAFNGSLHYTGTPPSTITETDSFPILLAAQNTRGRQVSDIVYGSFVVKIVLQAPPPPVWGMIPTQTINLSDEITTNNTLSTTATVNKNTTATNVTTEINVSDTSYGWITASVSGNRVTFSGTPPTNLTEESFYQVQMTAINKRGSITSETVSTSLNVTVIPTVPPIAPITFTDIPDRSIQENEILASIPLISFIDGADDVTLGSSPPWVGLDGGGGKETIVFQKAPAFKSSVGAMNSYTVQVIASHEHELKLPQNQSFTISVTKSPSEDVVVPLDVRSFVLPAGAQETVPFNVIVNFTEAVNSPSVFVNGDSDITIGSITGSGGSRVVPITALPDNAHGYFSLRVDRNSVTSAVPGADKTGPPANRFSGSIDYDTRVEPVPAPVWKAIDTQLIDLRGQTGNVPYNSQALIAPTAIDQTKSGVSAAGLVTTITSSITSSGDVYLNSVGSNSGVFRGTVGFTGTFNAANFTKETEYTVKLSAQNQRTSDSMLSDSVSNVFIFRIIVDQVTTEITNTLSGGLIVTSDLQNTEGIITTPTYTMELTFTPPLNDTTEIAAAGGDIAALVKAQITFDGTPEGKDAAIDSLTASDTTGTKFSLVIRTPDDFFGLITPSINEQNLEKYTTSADTEADTE